jgi:CRP/FNR family cyclic AMP-dependent transcriptional regulator
VALGGKNRKVDLLAGVSLFSQCSRKELTHIASLADQLDVDAGAVLTKEGEPGRECFVVIDGEAGATLRGKKLATLGAGSIFGEMALIDRSPRSATVTATTPMQLLVLGSSQFWSLMDDHPSVARKVMRALAERLRAVEQAPTY